MFPLYVTTNGIWHGHYSTHGHTPEGCYAIVWHDTYTDYVGACCGCPPVVERLRVLTTNEEAEVGRAVRATIGTWMHWEFKTWITPLTPSGGEWTYIDDTKHVEAIKRVGG